MELLKYHFFIVFITLMFSENAIAIEKVRIKNINVDRCLNVQSPEADQDGGNATMSSCSPIDNQRWEIIPTGFGWNQIRNIATSRCLNVHGRDARDGGIVTLYGCANTSDQKWRIDTNSLGQTVLRNRSSGRCLNVHRRDHNFEDAPSTVYSCVNTASDQKWRVIDANVDDITDYWEGEYSGRLNGRILQISIELHHREVSGIVYTLRLFDRARNISYSGITLVPYGRRSHYMENVRVNIPGSREQYFIIERLYLHKYNRNILSGTYLSNGGDRFGIVASREGFDSTARLNRSAATPEKKCEWAGLYGGYMHGKPARLEIAALKFCNFTSVDNQERVSIELTDISRNKTYSGNALFNPNQPHTLRNVRLVSDDGTNVDLPLLVMHIWNTNYLSGYYGTASNNWGLAFSRLEPVAVEGRNPKSREGCNTCSRPGSVSRNPPLSGNNQGCDSSAIGIQCSAHPSECENRGSDWNITGETVCRNSRIVCDISESRGVEYCTASSPLCGLSVGARCSSSNECVPGSACNLRSGRCEPISASVCRVNDGICWRPSELSSNLPELCRASDNIPEVPYDYSSCRDEEEGTSCQVASRRCTGLRLSGSIRCFATSRQCIANEEPEICP